MNKRRESRPEDIPAGWSACTNAEANTWEWCCSNGCGPVPCRTGGPLLIDVQRHNLEVHGIRPEPILP